MAEQTQPNSAKNQILNDRTYQEVEYLKKNLGPILVAALAEICIRRPADPIEYLGHWLLRWRYNEELKRRDVQNALEVVRQKAWTKDDETLQAPAQAPAPQTFTQGFVPGAAYAPPGYGGPLDQNVVEETLKPERGASDEVPAHTSGDAVAAGTAEQAVTGSGELAAPVQAEAEGPGAEPKTSPVAQEERRRSSQPAETKQASGPIEHQRTSLNGQERRTSAEAEQGGERRASRKSGDGHFEKQPSDVDANNEAAPVEDSPPAE